MKKLWAVLCLAILCCTLTCFPAQVSAATEGLTVTPTICAYSTADESFKQDFEKTSAFLSSFQGGTCPSFCFRLRNDGGTTCRISNSYVLINGGERLGWGEFSLAPGQSTLLHVFTHNMKKLGAGIYRVELYLNGSLACTQYFTLLLDWFRIVSMPDALQTLSYRPSNRAPYITFYPDCTGVDGFTAYSVDFIAEYQPKGTYLCTCNWWLDDSALKKQYASVDMQGASGYCGFQVLEDGSRVAIMSLWDIYCKDRAGNQKTIRGKLVYPESGIGSDSFDNEGNGVHCLTPYDWKEDHPYRMLLQQERAGNGNAMLTMWACDLETMAWTRLVSYDLGMTEACIQSAACFLEDFIARDGSLRSMELCNFRVLDRKTGRWKPILKGSFAQYYDYPGSYAYGADNGEFWCITTALPGVWKSPANNMRFQVSVYDPGDPF